MIQRNDRLAVVAKNGQQALTPCSVDPFPWKKEILKNPLAIAAVIALLSTTTAFAHAHLLEAGPAAAATAIAAPTALTLRFSEAIALKFSGVKVFGPDKAEVGLGTSTLDPKNDALLEVAIVGALSAGQYTVAWHALSSDGHKTNGTYTFTVK